MIDSLSAPFRLTLVGKFSHGRPSMERSRSIFSMLDLKGNYFLGHLDAKHILIKLDHEGDFNRLWLKDLMFLDGFPMRVFRWTPDFRSDIESSLTPVWVGFPNLPIYMFNKVSLFSIGRLIGTPLTLDIVIAEFRRPSLAKICIQVDLLNPLPRRVWLNIGDSSGF